MIAIIRPRPSDPRISIIILVFSSIPPKNGTALPNNIEISMATATIRARNLVISHNAPDNLLIISNIFPLYF
jgi:hypothetical protein